MPREIAREMLERSKAEGGGLCRTPLSNVVVASPCWYMTRCISHVPCCNPLHNASCRVTLNACPITLYYRTHEEDKSNNENARNKDRSC